MILSKFDAFFGGPEQLSCKQDFQGDDLAIVAFVQVHRYFLAEEYGLLAWVSSPPHEDPIKWGGYDTKLVSIPYLQDQQPHIKRVPDQLSYVSPSSSVMYMCTGM